MQSPLGVPRNSVASLRSSCFTDDSSELYYRPEVIPIGILTTMKVLDTQGWSGFPGHGGFAMLRNDSSVVY
ncbi:hypothetical protein OKW21_001393 [Catalinimonas alkaloidigena]|uniref:hypothetical protein n=1 Tax=Catalinimonas alkaloidigena TaxID=1075417 RepID=UPI002405E5E1|nr:hypothetical protein [Catalinimonas alkaloidigena]MDF9796130.1 hypothetical protein [Catalinimonas alkaloidigena]